MPSDADPLASFEGAKLALFLGPYLCVTLRDETPGIPYPGHWDFPGGGREQDESPIDCALRETQEEIGLSLQPDRLIWGRSFEAKGERGWLFVAWLPFAAIGAVRFGDEGYGWRMMPPEDFVAHPRAVPLLRERLNLAQMALRPTRYCW
ncbi:MAG: NUDIX hydrolase [Pseudomonadota bacterium]